MEDDRDDSKAQTNSGHDIEAIALCNAFPSDVLAGMFAMVGDTFRSFTFVSTPVREAEA